MTHSVEIESRDREDMIEPTVLLFCPAVFGSFFGSRKNRSCGTNPINQSSQSQLIVNQSINRKNLLRSASTIVVGICCHCWLIDRLSDWLIQSTVGKLPHGDDFRVSLESDWTARDNTAIFSTAARETIGGKHATLLVQSESGKRYDAFKVHTFKKAWLVNSKIRGNQ